MTCTGDRRPGQRRRAPNRGDVAAIAEFAVLSGERRAGAGVWRGWLVTASPIIVESEALWSNVPRDAFARNSWRADLLASLRNGETDVLESDLGRLDEMITRAPDGRRWFVALASTGVARVRAAGWLAQVVAPAGDAGSALAQWREGAHFADLLNPVTDREVSSDRTVELAHHYLPVAGRSHSVVDPMLAERFAATITQGAQASVLLIEITTTDLAAFEDLMTVGRQLVATARSSEDLA